MDFYEVLDHPGLQSETLSPRKEKKEKHKCPFCLVHQLLGMLLWISVTKSTLSACFFLNSF